MHQDILWDKRLWEERLCKLHKRERHLLAKGGGGSRTQKELLDKLPPKLKQALDRAFDKGFALALEKSRALFDRSLTASVPPVFSQRAICGSWTERCGKTL